ncbi:hypothetical protein RintRC_7477 [Richelia intracellularis]|nr:hypothetical protein RintRC_7477 [Richelia intracellularis]
MGYLDSTAFAGNLFFKINLIINDKSTTVVLTAKNVLDGIGL